MIDVHSVPRWTRVADTAATQVFTGECELVRIIFPTGRPTTDTVTVYDNTSGTGNPFGVFKADGDATFLQPASIEVGASFDNGIRVDAVTAEPFIVVYRGTAA